MDKLSITLNDLFRYIFAGTIMVAGLLVGFEGFTTRLQSERVLDGFDSAAANAAWLIAILVLGTLIYTIHRAVLFRFVRLLVVLVVSTGWHRLCCCVRYPDFRGLWSRKWLANSKGSMTTLKTDVEMLLHKQRRESSILRGFHEWGSQVHLLYCACWAVLASQLVGHYLMDLDWRGDARCLGLWIALVLLAAALVHHFRLETFERVIQELECPRAFPKATSEHTVSSRRRFRRRHQPGR